MNSLPPSASDFESRLNFAASYLERIQRLILSLDLPSIASFVSAVMEARERNAQIFFLGNGGSASTASHFANDISIGTREVLKPFRAISLADNMSVLTAIANDHGYDQVFAKQLQVLLKPRDVVVGISASGNSANVVKAIEYAKCARAYTIGLTGFDGGKLRTIVDLSVHVPSAQGEYGPVEDMHMVLDHLLSACLANELRNEKMDTAQPLKGISLPESHTFL